MVNRKKTVALIVTTLLVWVSVHSALAFKGFYISDFTLPPRGFIAIVPPMIAIALTLFLLWRSRYMQQLSLQSMTYIQTFRFPLELIVFTAFFEAGNIPDVMTFYGANPDIIVGITAPIVAYLYFSRKVVSYKVLLAWNIICLGMLINISSIAILSLPYPFQQFGLNQPNVALLNFPFVLLPCGLVAIAYFCHFMSIHKLLVFKDNQTEVQNKPPNTKLEFEK